jgi:subtilisin family serine protease
LQLTLARTVAAALAATVLAGCGANSLTPSAVRANAAGAVEASKATLAKRLIVGFKGTMSKATLAELEKAAGAKVVKTLPKISLAVFETKGNLKATQKALLAGAGVQFVESELVAEQEPVRARNVTYRPTQGNSKADPLRKDQWHLDNMGVPQVWESGKALKTVTVAVVDTGVDLTHPDLQGVLVEGWNAAAPGTPPTDGQGHGTMTAGCVGAVANNGIGVAGVAPNAKIMPVKVGNSASSIVEAMMWAADHADMITMSLSIKPGMADYPAAIETTKRAAQYVMSKGVPMVCSMGNTGSSSKNVPSAFAGNEVPNLIAVGATDKNDKVTSFSTYGPWTTVSAPGAGIVTTAMGGKYQAVDGTSFSTPLTAGVVALMLGAGQAKDPGAIRKRLTETAKDIMTPGFDDKAGYGRVDAAKAVL